MEGGFRFSLLFEPKNLATVYLIVMITHFMFFEPYGVSPFKVFMMALAVPLLFFKFFKVTKALIFGSFYMFCVVFVSYAHAYVRFSTIGYLGMFVITYILFYTLIYQYDAFSLEYFINLLRKIIIIFGVVLVLQQAFVFVGIRNFSLLNLIDNSSLAVNKLPILGMESSHSARVIACLFLAYLKCNEFYYGEKLTPHDLFSQEHRKVTWSYLWMVFTMGSGTGYVAFLIICLYFLQTRTLYYILPLIGVIYLAAPYLHIEQVDRVTGVFNATMTGSTEAVVEVDNSAAARVSPILNTIFNTNLNDWKMWVGEGTYDETERDANLYHMETMRIGNINQYGLISFIASLIMVFLCIIRRFLSFETLLFFIILGGGLGNIAYGWGCFMIFTCISYFEDIYYNDEAVDEEMIEEEENENGDTEELEQLSYDKS